MEVLKSMPLGSLNKLIGTGKSHGHAGVSRQHALVLVNLGDATGSEVEELSQMVKADVNHKFGIYLEPEVIIFQ
jgi:UDP-N-acetylmuramate dehydrogenase